MLRDKCSQRLFAYFFAWCRARRARRRTRQASSPDRPAAVCVDRHPHMEGDSMSFHVLDALWVRARRKADGGTHRLDRRGSSSVLHVQCGRTGPRVCAVSGSSCFGRTFHGSSVVDYRWAGREAPSSARSTSRWRRRMAMRISPRWRQRMATELVCQHREWRRKRTAQAIA